MLSKWAWFLLSSVPLDTPLLFENESEVKASHMNRSHLIYSESGCLYWVRWRAYILMLESRLISSWLKMHVECAGAREGNSITGHSKEWEIVSEELSYCEILSSRRSSFRDTISPVRVTTTTLRLLNPEDGGTAMLRNICNIPEYLNFQGSYLSNLYLYNRCWFFFGWCFSS